MSLSISHWGLNASGEGDYGLRGAGGGGGTVRERGMGRLSPDPGHGADAVDDPHVHLHQIHDLSQCHPQRQAVLATSDPCFDDINQTIICSVDSWHAA